MKDLQQQTNYIYRDAQNKQTFICNQTEKIRNRQKRERGEYRESQMKIKQRMVTKVTVKERRMQIETKQIQIKAKEWQRKEKCKRKT